LQGVEVRDDDPRRAQLALVLRRDDVEFAVVAVRVGRKQDAQPVADRDAGRDDEEGVGEPPVVGVSPLVEHLPGDQHGHHDRLAAAGRHLARDAEQVGPRLDRPIPEFPFDRLVPVLGLLRHFGEEDERFECLDLAEKEPAETVFTLPVFQQGAGDGRHVRPTQDAPLLDVPPDLVDEQRFRPLFFNLVEKAGGGLFLRGRDREKVAGTSATFVDDVDDLAVHVPEVAFRFAVRRVQDRVFDRHDWHGRTPSVVRSSLSARSGRRNRRIRQTRAARTARNRARSAF